MGAILSLCYMSPWQDAKRANITRKSLIVTVHTTLYFTILFLCVCVCVFCWFFFPSSLPLIFLLSLLSYLLSWFFPLFLKSYILYIVSYLDFASLVSYPFFFSLLFIVSYLLFLLQHGVLSFFLLSFPYCLFFPCCLLSFSPSLKIMNTLQCGVVCVLPVVLLLDISALKNKIL